MTGLSWGSGDDGGDHFKGELPAEADVDIIFDQLFQA